MAKLRKNSGQILGELRENPRKSESFGSFGRALQGIAMPREPQEPQEGPQPGERQESPQQPTELVSGSQRSGSIASCPGRNLLMLLRADTDTQHIAGSQEQCQAPGAVPKFPGAVLGGAGWAYRIYRIYSI